MVDCKARPWPSLNGHVHYCTNHDSDRDVALVHGCGCGVRWSDEVSLGSRGPVAQVIKFPATPRPTGARCLACDAIHCDSSECQLIVELAASNATIQVDRILTITDEAGRDAAIEWLTGVYVRSAVKEKPDEVP